MCVYVCVLRLEGLTQFIELRQVRRLKVIVLLKHLLCSLLADHLLLLGKTTTNRPCGQLGDR